jgi:hypothetical protein
MMHAGFHADGLRIALKGGNKVSEEDRTLQLEKIIRELKKLDDEAFLDVADHLHWGVLKFYQPSTHTPIPNKILKRIQEKHPELLI